MLLILAPPCTSGAWHDLQACWGPLLSRSTLKRAAFPTLFAWAQLWLCCRRWWVEAGLVVTLHPLHPPPPTLQAGSHWGTKTREAGLVFLTARAMRGLSHGCWAVSHVLWGVRELPTRAEGPGRWGGVSPGRDPGEVCLLWGLGYFS